MTSREIVDEYFIENRTRLLEIAAFLDRVDRAGGAGTEDFRMRAFREGVALLSESTTSRLDRIQMLLSDPTAEPLENLDRKSALGAYDRWSKEVRK